MLPDGGECSLAYLCVALGRSLSLSLLSVCPCHSRSISGASVPRRMGALGGLLLTGAGGVAALTWRSHQIGSAVASCEPASSAAAAAAAAASTPEGVVRFYQPTASHIAHLPLDASDASLSDLGKLYTPHPAEGGLAHAIAWGGAMHTHTHTYHTSS